MKIKLCMITLVSALTTATADPFRNLGFDDATINITEPAPPQLGVGFGPIADMLPGWQLSSPVGDAPPFNQTRFVGLDLNPPGDGYTTLYDSRASDYGWKVPISGNYSFGMHPNFKVTGIAPPFTLSTIPFTLSQTGDIPPDAKSIRFTGFASPVEMQINGVTMPLFYNLNVTNPPAADIVGDISAFAGQTVELSFITVQPPNQLSGHYGLDSIRFSPEPIPEPRTWLLFGLGAGALWATRKKR